ncbi:MAG: hypothetical protein GC155_07345 [Alphaproteobacteria bacterium]|nr:hypothetical protein [Alphaproteobacteria bacterium]
MNIWLQIPYVINIAILVPVCMLMFSQRGPRVVFQDAVASSRGLELLVGALWLAILVASMAGLYWPRLFAPLLAIQVFYKAAWLLAFVAPSAIAGRKLPSGIAICFAGIVVAWPVFLALAFAG